MAKIKKTKRTFIVAIDEDFLDVLEKFKSRHNFPSYPKATRAMTPWIKPILLPRLKKRKNLNLLI